MAWLSLKTPDYSDGSKTRANQMAQKPQPGIPLKKHGPIRSHENPSQSDSSNKNVSNNIGLSAIEHKCAMSCYVHVLNKSIIYLMLRCKG